MRCLNQLQLIGRLIADPEVRITQQSGKTLAFFVLAVRRDWYASAEKEDVPTDFYRVVAWGKFAEFCGRVLKKGMSVLASGHLLTHIYETKNGNGKQTSYEMNLVHLNILSWPKAKMKEESFQEPVPSEEMPIISEEITVGEPLHATM